MQYLLEPMGKSILSIGNLNKWGFCEHGHQIAEGGGAGLKTVLLSVCGDLQHIQQNIRFLNIT